MKYILIRTLTLFLLAGCATEEETIEVQPESDIPGQDTGLSNDELEAEPITGAQTGAIVDEQLNAQEMLADPASPLATRIIYFDYDSATVSDSSLAVLEQHGNFIAGNGNVSVRLEGHADERGSREYNIGLGDRRAQSVRRILLFQGASSGQVETVSFGEEKPQSFGHDEAAWSQNRRVELIYNVR